MYEGPFVTKATSSERNLLDSERSFFIYERNFFPRENLLSLEIKISIKKNNRFVKQKKLPKRYSDVKNT